MDALGYALESLDDGLVHVRNNAAHPTNDIRSFLEWEVESLRRIADPAERRRKADVLDTLCVCAKKTPYCGDTENARRQLRILRLELGIDSQTLRPASRHHRAVSGSGADALLSVGRGASAAGHRPRSHSVGARPVVMAAPATPTTPAHPSAFPWRTMKRGRAR